MVLDKGCLQAGHAEPQALEEGERKGPPPAEYPHPLVEEAEEERRQKDRCRN